MVMLPFCVNLSALLSRLTRICFTFCRSVRSVGRSDGSLQMTCRPDFAMIGSSSVVTSRTRSGRLNATTWIGMRPASMRVMSRISLISVSRWRAFASMRERFRRCGALSSPDTPCSVMAA